MALLLYFMDKIKLGKITAPQGVKGEFRVFPYTDEITRFSEIDYVIIDGEKHKISKARYQKNLVILKVEGIDDRNAAEDARGRELLLNKEDMWIQPENTYFIEDLVGMDVVSADDGSSIGKLAKVIQNSSQDVYEIKLEEGKSFLLPAVKEFVKEVDVENRVMKIHLIEGFIQ